MKPEWAVYGGSFDPPHVAHVLAATYVLAAHGVARVLVTPTAAHAFGKRLTSLEHRLRMCELAFAPLRDVELCAIEGELPQPSYTLHTLQALAARHPGVQLRLLLGADLRTETHAWHDFEGVCALAPPLWVGRQGHVSPAGEPALPEISSSDIRRRIAAGESTSGLLSPAVSDYIREHGLYRGS
ncbi:MAG TPA: nicotinate-nicotinamide nucleotide adenylyltransferase [Polyangiales bacterium]|nr:nicotinate-nicotinamide nucleotide adenylyltransferase [Polyangiales bacterium]